MEPPRLATYVANNSKFRYLSGGSSDMDDLEVVEVMPSDFPSSTSNKRRRNNVIPQDVIEIDEDDDPSGVTIIGEKVSTGSKGKEKLMGYSKNWANQVKEALTQDIIIPASTTGLGVINDIPFNPLRSSGLEPNYINNLNWGSVNYGFTDFPYAYNGGSYNDGTTGSQVPFNATELYSGDLYAGSGVPFTWFEHHAEIYNEPFTSSSSSVPGLLGSSWFKDKKDEFLLLQPAQSNNSMFTRSAASPCPSSYTRDKEEDKDEVLKKYISFKRFDTVGGYSDHHYARQRSTQPQKNWVKAIQQEWKILEKDLPDSIFVRVYEERMDLLRAVIVGAEGTPYHDGLFFFDFFFSSSYPNVPPQVHYHSGGLRLNPNLYNCGKVCLSLLNTWQGRKEEKWTPRKSTVLQVLLSIQALVLNTKPYFNEPGYAPSAGTAHGEKQALAYSENTYILSCRTMLYTLRAPPRHFEEFVVGHFRERAHAILVACKAYMDGAQVGCLVGGGVQDVDEGDKSCSQNFKVQVGSIVGMLVPAFLKNGSKDCEQFLPQTNNDRKTAASGPRSYVPKW